MSATIKNAIIFLSILAVSIFVYIFFFKDGAPEAGLVSSTTSQTTTNTNDSGAGVDEEFLPLLLNVQNIKLDDSIFTDKAFQTLIDSSITLTPEGNEGRFNPFAPLGAENNPANKP